MIDAGVEDARIAQLHSSPRQGVPDYHLFIFLVIIFVVIIFLLSIVIIFLLLILIRIRIPIVVTHKKNAAMAAIEHGTVLRLAIAGTESCGGDEALTFLLPAL